MATTPFLTSSDDAAKIKYLLLGDFIAIVLAAFGIPQHQDGQRRLRSDALLSFSRFNRNLQAESKQHGILSLPSSSGVDSVSEHRVNISDSELDVPLLQPGKKK